jgi:endonuclease/exonuclease/phosphatase family metal-dependent hydrolase
MRKLATLLLVFICVSLHAQTVNVMSYNIRLDTKADGVNQWGLRIEKVSQLIRKYNPDLLGVQEALHNQMMDLKDNLRDYEFVGVGRDDGKEQGEYSAIFYKKDKYEVIQQNTFWLSETPHVPGSKSWDAAITRIVTYAILKDKSTGKTFAYFNTHFDHLGKEARKQSAALIKSQIARLNLKNIPLIVSGDFNSEPTDEPYLTMVDGTDVKLFDARPADDLTGTYCSFQVGSMTCKTIDYIFYTSHWNTNGYQVIQDHDGPYYPSDHLPVMAAFYLKK